MSPGATLAQSVRSLARQVKPIGSGLLIDFPRAAQDIIEQDPQDRVSYLVSSPPGSFLLGNSRLPGPPPSLQPATGEPLLYNVGVDGKAMRVALLEVNYGETTSPRRLRVQVAKSLAVQRRLTRELVADMRPWHATRLRCACKRWTWQRWHAKWHATGRRAP